MLKVLCFAVGCLLFAHMILLRALISDSEPSDTYHHKSLLAYANFEEEIVGQKNRRAVP
jgi:hypothetical protein